MCPLPVCEVRIKLGVSGAGRCQQNLRLEILVLAAEAKPANAPDGYPGHRQRKDVRGHA